MTSWRIDLTVLTDLSASMFAACFMILLIFLSLAQTLDQPPQPPQRSIEADGALQVVRRRTLAPAEMVDLLRAHGGAGMGIDIFADRIEVATGGTTIVLAPAGVEDGLRRAVSSGVGPARLYVFSNALYNRVIGVLAGSVQPLAELTVPRALRDLDRPSEAWNAAFLELGARSLDPDAFRENLAVLLQGGSENGAAGGGVPADEAGQPGSGAPGAPPSYTRLLARIQQWLATFAAIAFPAAGFALVLWIERRRLAGGDLDRASPPVA